MFAAAQHNLQGSQTVGMASHGNDSGLYVEFSIEAVHQPFKSAEAGRPIFEDTPYITIHFPGDKTKKVVRPVKMEDDDSGPADSTRFPKQWAAFKNQQTQTASGTPVTEWPPLTKSQALELKSMNIHTVEQLAQLPDTACSWLGSRDLRTKAAQWLETAKDHAGESRLQAVVDQQKAQIEALQAQIDDIVARAAQSEAAKSTDQPAAKQRRTATTTE